MKGDHPPRLDSIQPEPEPKPDPEPEPKRKPEPKPWTWVRTAEVSVAVALGILLIPLGLRSKYDALVPLVGGSAAALAIFAAIDRDRKLVKWPFGLAVFGLLALFLPSAAQTQEGRVDAEADAIIARDPDSQEQLCELVSEQSDAELAAVRSGWIEANSGMEPPPGLLWDELVSRC